MKTILEYLQKKHIDVQDDNQLIVEELAKIFKGKIKPNNIEDCTSNASIIYAYDNEIYINEKEVKKFKDKITKECPKIQIKEEEYSKYSLNYYRFFNENNMLLLNFSIYNKYINNIIIENNLANELKTLL